MESTTQENTAAPQYRRLYPDELGTVFGLRNGDQLLSTGYYHRIARTLEDLCAHAWGIELPPAGPNHFPTHIPLTIRDREGRISVAQMRELFEGAVQQTRVLALRMPLEADLVDGVFRRYYYADTNTAWIGFALGMRCAQRLASKDEAR